MKEEVKFYEEDGFVLAVFLNNSHCSPGFFECYSHVGQHSAASEKYIKTLKLASNQDAEAMKSQLEIEYDYQIINKNHE